MMSLYPGTGMGASGTGMMPGGSLSPQMLAMMQALQRGQMAQSPMQAPVGMGPQMPGVAAQGGTPTPSLASPMANYIGSGGNAATMMMAPHALLSQPAQPLNQPQSIGQGIQQGAQSVQSLAPLLQKLAGAQTGVPASGQLTQGGAMQVPSTDAGAGSIMNMLLQHYLGAGGAAP